jgi:nucleotide-binding universal stress UspA family protein
MLRQGVSQMHKLLVPFDSSDNAMRALEYAIRLAKEHGPMELMIAYAHQPPIIYGEIAIYLPEEKAKELQRQHSEDILRPAIEKAKRAGVTFTSQVLIGDIPKTIVSCAETLGCDGIVMGTRGMSAIGNLVMGSIATKVIHLSKIPVTLVK